MHTRFTLGSFLRLTSACIALTVTQTQASTIVAKHEIGHALGIGFNDGDPENYVLYSNEVTPDDDIDIDAVFAPLFPGGVLPVLEIDITASHFDGAADGGIFNNTLMAEPGVSRGDRVLQSAPDIVAIGSGYDAAASGDVPEPSTVLLMVTSILGVTVYRWRRRHDA